MMRTGHVPPLFNVSVVTPIPKKNTIQSPSDAQPISVSSVFATLFEALVLNISMFPRLISRNQFGYKNNCSCKNVFFAVNIMFSIQVFNIMFLANPQFM